MFEFVKKQDLQRVAQYLFVVHVVSLQPKVCHVCGCALIPFCCCCWFFSVVEQLGCKHLVMSYMTHEDPNVRYEALLAVQKLMVHNWYAPIGLPITVQPDE